MNNLVSEVMIETMRQARELSRIVEQVPHNGLRGQFRESFLSRALRPWLPHGMELGTGVIVDEFGSDRPSNQDDIVIYAPDLLPAVLPLIDRNIFLLDSVLVHIEVKSKLTAANLSSALQNAIGIDKLSTSYTGNREIRAIFAYKSDIDTKSELERLNGQLTSLQWNKSEPPITFICVDNKECFMHGQVHFGEPMNYKGEWINLIPENPEESTLAFISTLSSSVKSIRDSRSFVQLARFIYDNSKSKIFNT